MTISFVCSELRETKHHQLSEGYLSIYIYFYSLYSENKLALNRHLRLFEGTEQMTSTIPAGGIMPTPMTGQA